jgi:mono/diheme cytochrome c family protein
MRKALGLLVLLSWAAQGAEPETAERFRRSCSGCHGPTVATSATEDVLIQTIREGRPGRGMPAFGQAFTDAQIRGLVAYLRKPDAPLLRVGATIEAESVDQAHS